MPSGNRVSSRLLDSKLSRSYKHWGGDNRPVLKQPKVAVAEGCQGHAQVLLQNSTVFSANMRI